MEGALHPCIWELVGYYANASRNLFIDRGQEDQGELEFLGTPRGGSITSVVTVLHQS